jgi:hypothetical protein
VLEPRNIYVKLPGDVSDALIRVAGREWRHPKEQAGLLIAEGLRRIGELSSDRELAAGSPATRGAL